MFGHRSAYEIFHWLLAPVPRLEPPCLGLKRGRWDYTLCFEGNISQVPQGSITSQETGIQQRNFAFSIICSLDWVRGFELLDSKEIKQRHIEHPLEIFKTRIPQRRVPHEAGAVMRGHPQPCSFHRRRQGTVASNLYQL